MKTARSSSHLRKAHPPLMVTMVIISLTSVVGYRFYNQPQLAVGTRSPMTIKAPEDGRFEDAKTTQEKRKAIRTGIVPILQRNPQTTEQIEQTLDKFLAQIELSRQLAGTVPFVERQILSLSSQQYLRACLEEEWQTISATVYRQPKPNPSVKTANPSYQPAHSQMQQVIAELKTYRQRVSQIELEMLMTNISASRQRYTQAWSSFTEEKTIELNQGAIASLLELNEKTWQQTKQGIQQTAQRILTQGIPPGMPLKLLQETVSLNLSTLVAKPTQPLATELLLTLLKEQSNLEKDNEETKRWAEQAAQAVEPVIVEIKRGEVIVEQGETITQEDFVLLDAFRLSRRGINWLGLGLSGILVTSAVGVFCLTTKRVHRSMRRRDHLLLCLLSISTPLLVIAKVPFTDLPAVGLLTSSFYGSTLALTQVVLLTGLSTFAGEASGWEYLLAGAAGGLLAALMAARLRSRDELALLGGAIGLTQGGVYFVVNLILSAAAGTIWYAVLPGALFYGLSGIAWSIVALGISPYLERLFDLLTPTRLAELSNPNRPLLKRLATEAPGTFQHTLFVACLAEAAARELHCNVELVRAGTLYHDIGKMHDPLGFIENQMGSPNKHDLINNPGKSAQIIKKHVSEGLVIARKYSLPKAIRDFIPEHQGTLLISYFYLQAQNQAELEGGHPILESDFRYDGPIPQSRETGIVMLADGCEAALRSLNEATPESALSMINKIFKARWRDQQLAESGLKYEELPIIAAVFVRVWQQFHHQRLAYPKAALDLQLSKQDERVSG